MEPLNKEDTNEKEPEGVMHVMHVDGKYGCDNKSSQASTSSFVASNSNVNPINNSNSKNGEEFFARKFEEQRIMNLELIKKLNILTQSQANLVVMFKEQSSNSKKIIETLT